MSKPKIAVVIGSTRENRFGDKAADWIADIARKRGDLDIEVVDLRDYPLPFFDEVRSPAYAPSQNEVALRWQTLVDGFDGFIFTAAEYNHGPTAVLKNALDYAYREWNKKPAAFVGYGAVGGARAVEQLRAHVIELQMAPTKSAVHVAWGDFIAILTQGKKLEEFEHLNQAGAATVEELAWWAKALKEARAKDAALAKAA